MFTLLFSFPRKRFLQNVNYEIRQRPVFSICGLLNFLFQAWFNSYIKPCRLGFLGCLHLLSHWVDIAVNIRVMLSQWLHKNNQTSPPSVGSTRQALTNSK